MTVEIIDVTPPTIEALDVVVGPRGPAGGAGSGAVVHTQSVALGTWTIAHSLGRLPIVQVYVAGSQVDTDIDATTSQIVITFAAPAAGYAVIS